MQERRDGYRNQQIEAVAMKVPSHGVPQGSIYPVEDLVLGGLEAMAWHG